jgi:hypothetical protein
MMRKVLKARIRTVKGHKMIEMSIVCLLLIKISFLRLSNKIQLPVLTKEDSNKQANSKVIHLVKIRIQLEINKRIRCQHSNLTHS